MSGYIWLIWKKCIKIAQKEVAYKIYILAAQGFGYLLIVAFLIQSLNFVVLLQDQNKTGHIRKHTIWVQSHGGVSESNATLERLCGSVMIVLEFQTYFIEIFLKLKKLSHILLICIWNWELCNTQTNKMNAFAGNINSFRPTFY